MAIGLFFSASLDEKRVLERLAQAARHVVIVEIYRSSSGTSERASDRAAMV